MGWWSKDIMGGDSPLDVEGKIFEICNVEQFPEDDSVGKLTKKDFEKNLPTILEHLRKIENNPYYDEFAIGYQVLGVLMMKCGATIDEDLKIEIRSASETDSWAAEDDERREIVNNFHKALDSYDGTPIEIRSRGLFEVMAQHFSEGKSE